MLAKFTDEDENRIVAFMRHTFHKLIKLEDREKFYGCFHQSPELFEFVGGQRKTLLLMQQMAKRLVSLNKQRHFLSVERCAPYFSSISEFGDRWQECLTDQR